MRDDLLIEIPMFFFSSRRRHTRCSRDWSSDVCSSDLVPCGSLKHVVSSVDVGSLFLVRGDTDLEGFVFGLPLFKHRATVLGPTSEEGTEIGRASCRERV